MIENFYALLAKMGYSHPLHPMLTHIPMGMVIGMVIFAALGMIAKNNTLIQTAFHCSILALVALFPVVAAGILDWQHLMQGSWNRFIIAKMILAGILTVLLIVSIIIKKRGATAGKMLLIYLFCLACAAGLGYSGGELVYS
jgi:uncharacterized membrane protein